MENGDVTTAAPDAPDEGLDRRRLIGRAGWMFAATVTGAAVLPRPTKGAAPPPARAPAAIDGLKYDGMRPAAGVEQDILESLNDARVRHLARLGVPDVPVEQLVAAVQAGTLSADGDEDVVVRMQAELRRAYEKPMKDRHWAMVIDLRKCIGCSACTIACVVENKLPPGVVYRPVIDQEMGSYPHVTRRFLPRPCMHCDDPPCVPVCPVAATWKREDGIVAIDYDACIGCRYCITACPYNARTFDFGQQYTDGTAVASAGTLGREQAAVYEAAPAFEYGSEWERGNGRSPEGNARKCHFCAHRLDAGMLPECVTTCIGKATYFGDGNDPDSLVHELMGMPNVIRLKEELGTDPQVYYLA